MFGKRKRELNNARKRIEELEKELQKIGEEKLDLELELSDAQNRAEEFGEALQRERAEHKAQLSNYQEEFKKLQDLLQTVSEQLDFERGRAEWYEGGYLVQTERVRKLIQRCRELKKKLGKEPVLRIGDTVKGEVRGSGRYQVLVLDRNRSLQVWRYFEVEEGEQVRYRILEQRGAACVGYFVDNEGEPGLNKKVKIKKARRIFRPTDGEWDRSYVFAGFPEGLVKVRSDSEVPGNFKIYDSYIDRRFGRVYRARPVRC